jgi:hypothetical protein
MSLYLVAKNAVTEFIVTGEFGGESWRGTVITA